MTRHNKILAGLLVVQLVLAVVIYVPRAGKEEARDPGQALLGDFNKDTVTGIRITGLNDEQVTLSRDDSGNWVLPDLGSFPAMGTTVNALLDKLALMRTNRLISQQETSHRRLKVAEDEFERLVELTHADGSTQKVYLGSPGGINAIHARVDGEVSVYLLDNLSISDAGSAVPSWVDTVYFGVSAAQVVSLKLENAQGVFELSKAGEVWSMAGLAEGEVFNDSAFQSFLNQATAMRMTEPLGNQAKDEYGLNDPAAVLTLTLLEEEKPEATPEPEPTTDLTGSLGVTVEPGDAPTQTPEPTLTPEPTATPVMVERTYTVIFGKAQEEGGPVVIKASNSDYYVLMAASIAERFTNKGRDSFLVPPTPTPIPSATSTPTETPIASATPEVTATDISPTETPVPPTETAAPPTDVPATAAPAATATP